MSTAIIYEYVYAIMNNYSNILMSEENDRTTE